MRRTAACVSVLAVLSVAQAQELTAGGNRAPDPVAPLSAERTVIAGDIVHYRYEIPVGPGPYDRVGLHRVVKEKKPYEPIKTDDALFMIPGAFYRFDKLFLAALDDPDIPDTHAFPVFLADRKFDVWGIDPAWSLVPPGLADHSFMRDWGMEKDARDVLIAMATARSLRGSRDSCREYACSSLVAQMDQMASGTWIDSSGDLFHALGYLGATAPDQPSEILPGLSNLQAALLFVSQTWQVGPENPN